MVTARWKDVMNDIFQEKHTTTSLYPFATVYDCKRTFDKRKAAAQSHNAFAKIGLGIGGRKCVCHLHDKADGR